MIDKPLKVAIVAASPNWIGGHGVQANLLLHKWQGDSAVKASFIPIDPEFPPWLAWAKRIPFLRTVIRTPIYVRTLWHGYRGVDVAHVFSASYWSFLLAPLPAWLIARLRGRKVIINYRSGEARNHLRKSRTARAVLSRTDRVVVPSMYLVDVFREFGLAAQAVPNIVDLREFSYRARQPLRPYLICTRGFHPYYSADVVTRAFVEVKREFPEGRLCLVGKGSLESAIRQVIDDFKLTEVEFTGPVPHERIPLLLDKADIFVNASWVDNMPNSILEAFAAGTPVVTTAQEGIRYLVEHERTGLLCPVGDWKALADAVIRLLRDPELALRLAANAREESHRYSWEAIRGQWIEVYESTCEGNERRRTSLKRTFELPRRSPTSSR